jgi:hypothetical protein
MHAWDLASRPFACSGEALLTPTALTRTPQVHFSGKAQALTYHKLHNSIAAQ